MKSDKILLLVAALFGTLDVVATYVVGSSLIMNFVDSGESVLLHTTLFLFLYSLLFGAYLSFIPRKELRGKNRHEMMKTQGGHTAMLAYFLGMCVLAEVVRQVRKKGGHIDKVRRAIKLHSYGICAVKIAVCGYAISNSQSDIFQVKVGVLFSVVTMLIFACVNCFVSVKTKQ